MSQVQTSMTTNRPYGLGQYNSGQFGGSRPLTSQINTGDVVNQIIVGGEERRNFLARYWRFREWARHSALEVPTDVPEGGESSDSWKEDSSDSSDSDDEGKKAKPQKFTKYVDEPPGFRWVKIEIV